MGLRPLSVVLFALAMGCAVPNGCSGNPIVVDDPIIECINARDNNDNELAFSSGGCHTWPVTGTATARGHELVQLCGLTVAYVGEDSACIGDAKGVPMEEVILLPLANAKPGSRIEGYSGVTGGCLSRGGRAVVGNVPACTNTVTSPSRKALVAATP